MTRKELDELVDDFDTTLEKFINGLNVIVKKQFENSSSDKNLGLLMEYYGFMAYLSQEKEMEISSECARILYIKTMSDLYAIHSLLKEGSNYQAMEVLRSLTDTAITTKYISLDNAKRGPLFLNHKFIEDYFLASASEKINYEANYHLHKGSYKVNEVEGYSYPWYQKEMEGIN